MSNFNDRMDTISNILNYPQIPLVKTKLSKYTYSDELPAGINAIVAIASYTGFNQEDSVMINRDAVDRGLFVSTYYKCIKEQCSKNHSTGEEEIFKAPPRESRDKPYDYSKIGDDGFVPLNTYVKGGDIIIGKVMPRKSEDNISSIDCSIPMKPTDEGFIDMNYKDINHEGYAFCKIRIRNFRKPEIGDKLASKNAQKGSIGMIYEQKDMPFTKDGIVPDIIMNPHAIPSRMTIGQLIECILGKACCFTGERGDCTPFENANIETIAQILERNGMERYGNEILYDGRSGRQMKTEIFIGPTYYQRLKHMVTDKMHYRGNVGPIVFLTRQPSEGRSRSGGMRLGEMERDALIAHGTSMFLKERMLDVSDGFKQYICKNCGFAAIGNPNKNLYSCRLCKNDGNISQIRIPYAFKLLTQELHSMNVSLRYII